MGEEFTGTDGVIQVSRRRVTQSNPPNSTETIESKRDITMDALEAFLERVRNGTYENAADTIAYVVRRQASFEFDARCRAAMDDLAVASRVRADLALNSATSHLELEVVSKDGRVSIAGIPPDIGLASEIERVATTASGVKEVALGGVTSLPPA